MSQATPTTREPLPDGPGIGRREAIRRAGVLAGIVFAPSWLRLVEAAPATAQATPSRTHLWAVPLATAAAIADRILPRTDTPGAVDVGVPAFIDRLYGEYMTAAERQMLTSGLESVDLAATAAHGTAFRALAAAEQDSVLRAMAMAQESQPGGFFRMFRAATILGYFTSEEVGRNVLHYDPVPGRYEGCVPLATVGNRNWT